MYIMRIVAACILFAYSAFHFWRISDFFVVLFSPHWKDLLNDNYAMTVAMRETLRVVVAFAIGVILLLSNRKETPSN